MSPSESRVSLPQLHFRLPGTWFRVDLGGEAETEASIRAVVRAAVGTADDRAQLRAELRRDLRSAARAARQAEAVSLMFASEIAAGAPLPVTLVVFAPQGLRMSPSLGTSAPAVLGVLAESLPLLDAAAAATAVQVDGPGGPALRTHRIEAIEPVAETGGAERIVADYYVPVPQSKQVVMVRLSSPMGEISNVLLSLFDSLLAATYFRRASAG